MRPLAALIPMALLFGDPAFASDPKSKPPTEDRVRIANQLPFDVAACGTAPVAITGVPTKNMLAMALVLAQPAALECLTPATSRGKAQTTEVQIGVALSDRGAVISVKGDNLTATGASCITEVLQRSITFEPLATGAAPIELAGEIVHDATTNAAIESGINVPSDWVGAARGALPKWCSCYAPYANQRPPLLTADVRLAAGKSEVTFRKGPTPEADALAQCLLPNIVALPVPKSDLEFRFPLRLTHLHTLDRAPATELGPELAFQQSEVARLRLFAATELALTLRTRTAATYDASVAAYQKAPKASQFPVLVRQCNALVEADGAWLTAAQTLLAHEGQMAATTRALSEKDPSWKPAADAMAESRAATEQEVATATQTLEGDKHACPKVK